MSIWVSLHALCASIAVAFLVPGNDGLFAAVFAFNAFGFVKELVWFLKESK